MGSKLDYTPAAISQIIQEAKKAERRAIRIKFFETFNGCQSEYHKHFYESKKHGKWTSSQLNTYYQDRIAAFDKTLEVEDGTAKK